MKSIFVTRKIPPAHHALSDCPLVEGYQMERTLWQTKNGQRHLLFVFKIEH